MLAFYHQYIVPAADGAGPLIALMVLWLLGLIPLMMWETALARKVGGDLAARRTSWPGALLFLVILVIALYFYSH
jgi:hypothetical protein